jgi:N-acetylglucosaminyldiphosphoundecaprenol N-acetyl-beta-D-mannosaminyltransferase
MHWYQKEIGDYRLDDGHSDASEYSVNILGVDIKYIDKDKIFSNLEKWSKSQFKHTIFYINAHCLNIAYNDFEYRKLLNNADLMYPDGVGVVWASRLLGGPELEKMTGRDWIDEFCDLANTLQLKVYILAGKQGIAELAVEKLNSKWPDINFVGICDGYCIETKRDEILQDISEKSPHILFVGLGSPTQEKWIAGNRNEIASPICWGVGALFDFVAEVELPVPRWMDELALEWFWRFLVDPLGKWDRYLVGIPMYIFRILKQRILSR